MINNRAQLHRPELVVRVQVRIPRPGHQRNGCQSVQWCQSQFHHSGGCDPHQQQLPPQHGAQRFRFSSDRLLHCHGRVLVLRSVGHFFFLPNVDVNLTIKHWTDANDAGLQLAGSLSWARSRAPAVSCRKLRVWRWPTFRVRLWQRCANCRRGTASSSRTTPSTVSVTATWTVNWCSCPTSAAKSSSSLNSSAAEPSAKSTKECRPIYRQIYRDPIKHILELLLRCSSTLFPLELTILYLLSIIYR